MLLKAQRLLEHGEIKRAVEVLENFQTKKSPDYKHHYISFILGNCYLKLGDLLKAQVSYEAAVKVQPDFSPAWLNLAKCFYDLGKYSDAGRCFLKRFETSEEKDPETLYYSAVSFMVAQKNKKALSVFKRLMENTEKIKPEWEKALAKLYLNCDMPQKALPYIEKLARELTGKEKKEWQKLLLQQYLTLGMESKALLYAKELTKESPKEPDWWKTLALIYLQKEKYKDALVSLTICSYLKPFSRQEKRLLADLNFEIRIPIKATSYYENLIEEKEDPQIYERLVYALLLLHRPQKALDVINKALKHFQEKKLYMLKGRILFENERYKEAMYVYEKAAPKMPDSGKAWLMAGYSALNSHFFKKAAHYFKKACAYPEQKKRAEKALCRSYKIINIRNILP